MAIKLEFVLVYLNVYLSFMAEVLDRDDTSIGNSHCICQILTRPTKAIVFFSLT